VALAQSDKITRERTGKSQHNISKAPIGHEQPTSRDATATKRIDESGLLGEDADDKALDKKIKSICRGCM